MRRIIGIISVIAGLLATNAFAVELVVNGGFETPAVTGGGGFDYRTGSQLPGWLITAPRGEPQFNGSYFGQTVGSGLQSLQLESISPITQSFATTPGQAYTLSFLFSSYNSTPGVDDATLEVMVAGINANFLATDAAYLTEIVQFTALDNTTTLSFRNSGVFAQDWAHLDNVSVEAVRSAVPEPGSLALLGGAFAAFGLSRRRRKT